MKYYCFNVMAFLMFNRVEGNIQLWSKLLVLAIYFHFYFYRGFVVIFLKRPLAYQINNFPSLQRKIPLTSHQRLASLQLPPLTQVLFGHVSIWKANNKCFMEQHKTGNKLFQHNDNICRKSWNWNWYCNN